MPPMQGAPAKITPRHQHMAALVARGLKNHDIAREMGYSESRVSIIKSSPLFQQLVVALMRDIRSQTTVDVAERLMEMGQKAIGTIDEMMDQRDNLSVAYQASAYTLDRNPHIAALKVAADIGARAMLDAEAIREIQRGIQLDEGRPDAIPAVALSAAPAEVAARPLDEVIASLKEDDDV